MKLEMARKIARTFMSQIQSGCSRVEIAGSVRREKPEVHDIEICAIPNPIDLFWLKEIMDAQQYIKGKFPSKYSRIISQCEKIDIFWCSKDNWGNIYLIRTGPWEFSKWIMGTKTREVGLRQREGSLWRGNKKLSCPEEADVFKLLGMDFIEPKDRVFREVTKQGYL